MMAPHEQIVLAQPEDISTLSTVIALAFHPLAPSQWLIPDPAERARVFPGYFRLYVTDAMERGHVYTTQQRTAVALWFPAGPDTEPDPPGYDEALAAATGAHVDRFRLFDTILAKHHPHHFAHDHLAIMAVRPDHQRHGTGTALLTAHHTRLDTTTPPRPAFLEAGDTGPRELYLQHGYRDYGPALELPHGPQMYPMLRAPEHD